MNAHILKENFTIGPNLTEPMDLTNVHLWARWSAVLGSNKLQVP